MPENRFLDPNQTNQSAAHGGITHVQPCSGVLLDADGTLHFLLHAPQNASVSLTLGTEEDTQITCTMHEGENGIYKADLENCPLRGPQMLVFYVDGHETFNPAAPMWYHRNMLCNYAELPDPETDALIEARKDIEHGTIRHEFYYSEVYGEFASSLVYVPPCYEEGKDYPVIYLFHEVKENKTAWTDAPKINYLFDNMISDGKCAPFILVENDCTVLLDYRAYDNWFTGYPELEKFLLCECIPYMESHYRIKSAKNARAIAGFGLGAVQAAYIGMQNTDVFGSIGLFTAFWISSFFHEEGRPDPFYDAAKYIGEHPEVLDVFYRSEGDLDAHFDGIKKENELLSLLKVDQLPGYRFEVYHQSHGWGSYRRSLRDFLPLLFKN